MAGGWRCKDARFPLVGRIVEAIVNGEARSLRDGTTISDLISEIGLAGRRVAVEINRNVVSRSEYPTRALVEGDHVEIVHFVGGG